MPSELALANRAWESLMTAHTALLRQFAAEGVWREHGITMREYDVLYTLAKFAAEQPGEPARIGELQHRVLLSQPALSRMVDRLAERGLVERLDDVSDRRAVCVRLSPTGRDLQRAVGRAHARSVGAAVGGALAEHELLALAEITDRLVEHADPSLTKPTN